MRPCRPPGSAMSTHPVTRRTEQSRSAFAHSTLLAFFAALLAALSLSRLALCGWQYDRVLDAGGTLTVLRRGVRTDVVLLSSWLLPVLVPRVRGPSWQLAAGGGEGEATAGC